MPNSTIGCSSLETYSAMCAEALVCVDWRGETKGQCGRMVLFQWKSHNVMFRCPHVVCYFKTHFLLLQNILVQRIRSTSLVGQVLYQLVMRGKSLVVFIQHHQLNVSSFKIIKANTIKFNTNIKHAHNENANILCIWTNWTNPIFNVML